MCISSTWPGQQVVELGKLHGKQLPRHANHYLIHHAAWKVPFSTPLPTLAFLLPQGHQTRILTAAAWAFTLKNLWCTSLEWSMQFWMTEHFKQCEFGAKSLAKSVTPNVDVWSTQPIASGQGHQDHLIWHLQKISRNLYLKTCTSVFSEKNYERECVSFSAHRLSQWFQRSQIFV